MNIIYSSSNKYAPYCGISILSLFENNKDAKTINVYVIDGEISEENKKKFRMLERQYGRIITFLDRSKEIETLKQTAPPYHGHHYTLIRALPGIMFPDVDKILSLGADTIIHQSIHSLYSIDLENHLVAWVLHPEFYNGVCIEDPIITSKNPYYFNADVMLFNLNLWRQNDYDRKMLQAFNDHKFILAEQSALAYILEPSDSKLLPPRYNYWGHIYPDYLRCKMLTSKLFFTKEEIEEAHNSPVIIHYTGYRTRPWIDGAFADPKYKEIFKSYKKISPWANHPNESMEDYYKFKNLPFCKPLNRAYLKFRYIAPFWIQKQFCLRKKIRFALRRS